MNLGEALLELKQMKSELSRLITERQNKFKFLKPTDGKVIPDGFKQKEFEDISNQIRDLGVKIRKLKIRVENTNHNSFIDTSEGKMTIAECIILIGDLRAELSNLETLRKNFNTDDYRYNDEKYSLQLSEKELLSKIHELEKRKTKLDSFLSSYNWRVILTKE